MSRYAFLITSAVNTKFGVYSNEERLGQTLATISGVRKNVPDAKIIVLEMGAIPLTAEQSMAITGLADNLITFSDDPAVTGLYHSTDNWDVVKNVTEVMCFQNALKKLYVETTVLHDVQRIFKLSGRYLLNDNFDIGFYDAYANENMIVVGKSRSSQFPFAATGVERQYMSRLWSWPSKLTPEVITGYNQGLEYMYQRLAAGGYVDIEHVLYKFLDPAKVLEKDVLGLHGNIGPNGAAVAD